MNKRRRNILLIFLIAIFLIVAPFLILYSQGYRIDFENRKLTQTGALFFKIEPGRSEILISKNRLKKTSFLFQSALVENLVPDKYSVEITKEGYYSWEKELEVKAKTVTESKGIILIPIDPEITIASKNTQQIWELSNKNYILLDNEDEDSWALKIYDIEKRLKTYLLEEADFNSKKADFLELITLNDDKKVIVKIAVNEEIKYYLLDLSNPSEPLLLTYFIPDNTIITLDPSDSKNIIYIKNNIFYRYDTEKQQYSPILDKDDQLISKIISYKIIHNDIYLLNEEGFLIKTNSSFNNFEEINQVELEIKKETPYSIEIFNDFIFITENKTAYLLNKETKEFEFFFDNIKYLKPSPDYTKVVYGSNHEMWFMYLQEVYENSKKNSGDKEFLIKTSQNIKEITWLNSSYIAYAEDNTIKITETDTRDKINIVDIAEMENTDLLWNGQKKELLIISNSNLYLYYYPLF